MICKSSKASRRPFMGTLSTLTFYQCWNLGHAGVRAIKIGVRRIYDLCLSCRYVKGSPEKGELGDCESPSLHP